MRSESRRQKKLASLIKEMVSEIILYELQDPRIEGLISVTRVEVSNDLRNFDVFVSVLGEDEKQQNLTYSAILSARHHVQQLIANRVRSRYCPTLRFKWDQKYKDAIETMRLIDEAAAELDEKDSVDREQQ